MDNLLADLHEYQAQTITLRLTEEEATALFCRLLVDECGCESHERLRPVLAEKLGCEMDAFKWRQARG